MTKHRLPPLPPSLPPPANEDASPKVPAVGVSTRRLLGEPLPLSEEPLPAGHVGVGDVLEGKYRLDILIGSGGFGSVYRAVHLGLRNTVAIKVMHPHLVQSPAMVRRFRIEGISSCRVKHPNAVSVLDTGSTNTGIPYLVMEYLEGRTLDAELRNHGMLPFRRVAAILDSVCEVLIHAHAAGIIHRDIKPANIHLCQTARGEIVKVLDFGLAKLMETDDLGSLSVSSGDNLIGTPQFMAPERLAGKPADGRADVYSVGATLYLMLAGSLPFGDAEDSLVAQALKQINTPPIFIQRLRPDLPDELAVLVMRMLARRRSERPKLQEVRQQLATWAVRWQEVWPPAIQTAVGAPLEIGDTMNISLDAKPDKKPA